MKQLPKVTIGVILFKGEKYLEFCLKSLVKQDYPNLELLIRDQSPGGEAYDFIQKNLPELMEKMKLERGENIMHSGGHNALINKMSGEYYFCCSNDMIYPQNFVSEIIAEMEKPENQKYGSATCKLMQWHFQKITGKNLEESKSDIIDSCGVGITKGHYFFDIGQGQKDNGTFNQNHEIFGPSGALSVFRKKALEDIAYLSEPGQKEYYDEMIHYKNDVDLAYRLQWAGYPSLFIANVKVYHDRQVESAGTKSSLINSVQSRKNKALWVKESSVFGQLVVLKKNFQGQAFSLSVKIQTYLRNFLQWFYILCFERYLLKQYQKVKTLRSIIEEKTKKMPRKIKPNAIEKFMKG